MHRSAPLIVAATTILALSTATSYATRRTADACAAHLPAKAKLIYASVIHDVRRNADIREIMTDKVTALVMAGKLRPEEARPAAEAAGVCLSKAM